MYKITGKFAYTNRNFKAIHTDNFRHAMGINLWRGNVWELTDGHWKKIKEVYN